MLRFLWAALVCCMIIGECVAGGKVAHIAVIGGGMAGTSAAYHIRKLFNGDDIRIDIYEPENVGGRVTTVEIGGRKYEAGASVIHPLNKYMYDLHKLFGLRIKDKAPSKFGLYDGEEYMFKESDWSAITSLRMLWRYGFCLLKVDTETYSLVDKLSRIYELQDKGHAYTTLVSLLTAMDPMFVNMTSKTAREALLDKDFTERFIDELAMAAMKVNYGQTPDINALVGFISLAGAQPGLWNIYGGNDQIPAHLMEASMSNLINSRVVQLKHKDGKFTVISANEVNPNNSPPSMRTTTGVASAHDYDIVVIAAPMIDGVSNITFTGFPKPIKNFPGKYHRTVATFVLGQLNYSEVNLRDENEIDAIFSINPDLYFNSISYLLPVDYTKSSPVVPNVWKIFSEKVLTDKQLDRLFVARMETKVYNWLAYPHYTPPDHLGTFKLFDNLYYANSIEWAGSAMEMSVIAGRNVALLAYNEWKGKPEWIDVIPKRKDEL